MAQDISIRETDDNIKYYETAVPSAAGDVLTIDNASVRVGGAGQTIDFKLLGTSRIMNGNYTSVVGDAQPISANTWLNGFFSDDGGVAQTAGVRRNLIARTYFSIDQGAASCDYDVIRGHLKAASGVDFSGDTSTRAAVRGYSEFAGATIVGAGAFFGSVFGELWGDGNITGTGLIGGLMSRIYTSAGTVSGSTSGVVVCKHFASTQKFRYGLYNQKASVLGDIKVQAEDAASLPCVIFSGPGTSDGTIVTDVGADTLWADGSLYISVVDGAGLLFQKQNDVWVNLQA